MDRLEVTLVLDCRDCCRISTSVDGRLGGRACQWGSTLQPASKLDDRNRQRSAQNGATLDNMAKAISADRDREPMMSDETIQVLAMSGSLRRASFNTALLQAAQELTPEGMSLQIYTDLASIPPYDDDVRLAGYPPAVATLRDRVRAADALIFATPEYNRSFAGVLKNAIDWMSRPPAQPLDGKPAAVMGAGPGVLGTALANYQLRQVLSVLNVHVVPGLEVLVGDAANKFDGEGRLFDEPTRGFLAKSLVALMRLTKRLKYDPGL
jgi:chromate reductase